MVGVAPSVKLPTIGDKLKPAISLSNVATVRVWEARLVKAVAGDAVFTAILIVLLTVPVRQEQR